MSLAAAPDEPSGTGGPSHERSAVRIAGGGGRGAKKGSVRRGAGDSCRLRRGSQTRPLGSETLKLGDLEFHVLSDGHVLLDGGAMFGVIPKPMWEKKMPPDARNRITLSMNCLLIIERVMRLRAS